MPKPTFFNLPEAKRQTLIDIAIDEFAEHDYRNASITRIVAKAGIAKGSIYQYFEDKQDLYLYLLQLAGEQKLTFVKELQPPDPQMGIFNFLRWLMEVGTRFRFSHPRLDMVVYRALYSDQQMVIEAVQQMRQQSDQYWSGLVAQGIAQGDIDPSYDPHLVRFVFTTLMNEVGRYALERTAVPQDAADMTDLIDKYSREIQPKMNELIQILEHGLGRK